MTTSKNSEVILGQNSVCVKLTCARFMEAAVATIRRCERVRVVEITCLAVAVDDSIAAICVQRRQKKTTQVQNTTGTCAPPELTRARVDVHLLATIRRCIRVVDITGLLVTVDDAVTTVYTKRRVRWVCNSKYMCD